MEENKNAIAIKVYDIDYSFIIKNYLDKSLWEKEWTLFVYKNYVFSLSLININTQKYELSFEVRLNRDSKWGRDWTQYCTNKIIYYNLKSSNINILKKQINGAIFEIISEYEKGKITEENEYQNIVDYEEQEEKILKETAENFLNDNNVTNREIRETYIDSYVYNNKKIYDLLKNYMSSRKYKVLTDLYLIFLEITKDNNRKQPILSKLDDSETIEVMSKVNEYLKKLETEEYKEELKDNLESI